jgi:hypothetical protein
METALAIEGRFHEGKKSGSLSRFSFECQDLSFGFFFGDCVWCSWGSFFLGRAAVETHKHG